MVICDLEYYEIGSQVSQIKEVEGGRFSFLAFSGNTVSIGKFTAVQARIDTISQQGDDVIPSISGFSFTVQSIASAEPFQIG